MRKICHFFFIIFVFSVLAEPVLAKKSGPIRIIKHSIKWIDHGDNYSDYAWKIKLRNTTDNDRKVYIEIRLLDKKGYVLDMTNDNVVVHAHKFETYRGSGMMKNNLVRQVRKTEAKIKIH